MRLFCFISTESSLLYTAHALRTFFLNTEIEKSDRVIVIDNDGSLDPALVKPRWEQVQILRNPKPFGFAANANQAIKLALAEGLDLFLLNNDLLFTPNWIWPLMQGDDTIFSPTSNREFQYTLAAITDENGQIFPRLKLRQFMDLEELLGQELALAATVNAHQANFKGELPHLTLPFFCVRIPNSVIERVGLFDESFGKAGGEDFDYALRAWACGCRVSYALQSFVIHFGGKSSWTAAEKQETRRLREEQFISVFTEKWGSELQHLAFNANATTDEKNIEASDAFARKDYKKLVELLSVESRQRQAVG